MTFNKSKDKKTLTSLHVIHPFGVPDWVLGEWSECSKSCGSGWSRRSVECRDNAGFLSAHCDRGLEPSDIRPCGDVPCPIWQMGPWSACSRTCGQGERRRSVFCIDYTGKTVEPEKCDSNRVPQPISTECLNQECLWDEEWEIKKLSPFNAFTNYVVGLRNGCTVHTYTWCQRGRTDCKGIVWQSHHWVEHTSNGKKNYKNLNTWFCELCNVVKIITEENLRIIFLVLG